MTKEVEDGVTGLQAEGCRPPPGTQGLGQTLLWSLQGSAALSTLIVDLLPPGCERINSVVEAAQFTVLSWQPQDAPADPSPHPALGDFSGLGTPRG